MDEYNKYNTWWKPDKYIPFKPTDDDHLYSNFYTASFSPHDGSDKSAYVIIILFKINDNLIQ